MSRSTWYAVVVVVMFIATVAWHTVGFVLAGIGLFAAYFISLRAHPRTRHTGFRGCGGTGEHKGFVLGWGHRRCNGCQSGRTIRVGARYMGPDYIKTQWHAGKESRKAAKENHRWR